LTVILIAQNVLRRERECENEEQTGPQVTVRIIRQFGKDDDGFENITF
jgi:hypothetical protein